MSPKVLTKSQLVTYVRDAEKRLLLEHATSAHPANECYQLQKKEEHQKVLGLRKKLKNMERFQMEPRSKEWRKYSRPDGVHLVDISSDERVKLRKYCESLSQDGLRECSILNSLRLLFVHAMAMDAQSTPELKNRVMGNRVALRLTAVHPECNVQVNWSNNSCSLFTQAWLQRSITNQADDISTDWSLEVRKYGLGRSSAFPAWPDSLTNDITTALRRAFGENTEDSLTKPSQETQLKLLNTSPKLPT